MKLWKRNAVVAAIVLFVCVAVYLNWSYGQTAATSESNGNTSTLGEAALVSAADTDQDRTDASDSSGVSDTDADGTVASSTDSEYFDTARLNRQEARDSALAILQATVDDEAASAETIAEASASITAMAEATLAESEIENLVIAKGYLDCMAYIGENSVSVVVETSSGDLTATDVAKITDIVLGETEVDASAVKIIQAGAEE